MGVCGAFLFKMMFFTLKMMFYVKNIDFHDFSVKLPRLKSHNFRATEQFKKSRHSRIIY